MDKNYDVMTFISKYPYFKKTWSCIFTDIIKIVSLFIKTITKDSKLKRIGNYLANSNLYVYFLM